MSWQSCETERLDAAIEIRGVDRKIASITSDNSPIAAQRKFAAEYKLKTIGPIVITIKNVIEKFERAGSVDVSTLQRVLLNFALHLRHVIAIGGKHIEHVIN
ncbi:hypothetical protein AVEN_96136-1 [Araneus ventricosus]|uniref:Uncharacterized protein n=1 Tax=Araneus ventricosus TaxID=182803 RepID=A0A4Y2V8A7_ARAVE|nr:hypothetical protein AVEN_96136-1 [Araneus ventricosus]